VDVLGIPGLSDLLARALLEDVGHGDVTTAATVGSRQKGVATITAKQSSMIFCGGPLLRRIFELSATQPEVLSIAEEGTELKAGECAATIEGLLAGLLIGERIALNFAQLMSGIATLTREYVQRVAGTKARIVDTRKTHPGLRAIEKYAVRIGGGFNHRFGLDSGVLIKENHIAAAGSIAEALRRARQNVPHTFRIEIECETLAQVHEAVDQGADSILLDNMSLEDIRKARSIAKSPLLLEVSGGVNLDSVRALAETGIDVISVGALTHSARAVDLSMRIEPIA
jgi:nicotinate-nucleotide pyrophosphorylase (carboxylating)